MRLGISTALTQPVVRLGGGSPPVYVRTAFVSATGNDGTAALNNPALPFLTPSAAIVALDAAYPGQTATLQYQSDVLTIVDTSAALDNILAVGLTVMSNNATVRQVGQDNLVIPNGPFVIGSNPDAILTLSKVYFHGFKPSNVTTDTKSAGVITGDSGTTLTLSAQGDFINTKAANGNFGSMVTGVPDNAPQPDPDSPPDPGVNGGDAISNDAVNGDPGAKGARGWDVTLLGAMTVESINTSSTSVGGDGGDGGGGGVANGGAGGIGGDSNAIALEDGGTGGNGGNATSQAADGGAGGDGGDGGNITKAAGVTITLSVLSGAAGGAGGSKGIADSASSDGGIGGVGGQGAIGGSQGPSGSDGMFSAIDGNDGAPGAPGADGTITTL